MTQQIGEIRVDISAKKPLLNAIKALRLCFSNIAGRIALLKLFHHQQEPRWLMLATNLETQQIHLWKSFRLEETSCIIKM